MGDRDDSNVYIRMKAKAGEEIGVDVRHVKLAKSTTEGMLLDRIRELNADPAVSGIIVQMPLEADTDIDAARVLNAVDADKDVDGLGWTNKGRLSDGDVESGFVPCTPAGCLELIRRAGIEVAGADAVVVGRSRIVGSPMAQLLKWSHATVQVCHSKTKNLEAKIGAADILVVAMGKPEFVKGSWIKEGAVVIDCGINSVNDATKKAGYRLVGDVEYASAAERASFITPVPGGVGPMTVAFLMHNTVRAAVRDRAKLSVGKWDLRILPLNPLAKVRKTFYRRRRHRSINELFLSSCSEAYCVKVGNTSITCTLANK